MNDRKEKIMKDVVIIGNGPSAITLSYMLAGNWPYYNELEGHTNEVLHNRMVNEEENYLDEINEYSLKNEKTKKNRSLIEKDLEYLSCGIQGRSINPISNFFDSLLHPDADIAADIAAPIYWKNLENECIEHIVIGEGKPGGAWFKMDDCKETLTISIANWMQLPGLNIKQWNKQRNESRLSFSCVAKYYKDYVDKQNLSKYFLNESKVTQLYFNAKNNLWHVIGYTNFISNSDKNTNFIIDNLNKIHLNNNNNRRKRFHYVSPKVVLATGCSEIPKRLNIPGECNNFVLHSLNQLEQLLLKKSSNDFQDPLLIVGSGLSAADAVIATHFRNIPIVHVFRRHPEDPALIFNQLPENLYPEYHKVHSRMSGRVISKDYKPLSMHSLISIGSDHYVTIKNLINNDFTEISSSKVIKVSFVLILIGMKPNLNFLQPKYLRKRLPVNQYRSIDSRLNPIKINQITHECVEAPGLFAMGPLVGDNFVRFLQGGALAITSHLWHEKQLDTEKSTSVN